MITNNVIFRRFTVGYYPINGYLLADRKSRTGVFIDPGGYHDEIVQFIDEQHIDLKFIFLTHHHPDHIEGVPSFIEKYSPICYGADDEVPGVENILKGGERLEVGALRFQTFSTPGHSPHAISYYCVPRLFPGDALFCGSVGGTSSPKDAQTQLDHVRNHLFTLPGETLVFPGHGPITTIAAERYANPFFH